MSSQMFSRHSEASRRTKKHHRLDLTRQDDGSSIITSFHGTDFTSFCQPDEKLKLRLGQHHINQEDPPTHCTTVIVKQFCLSRTQILQNMVVPY